MADIEYVVGLKIQKLHEGVLKCQSAIDSLREIPVEDEWAPVLLNSSHIRKKRKLEASTKELSKPDLQGFYDTVELVKTLEKLQESHGRLMDMREVDENE
jgi:hypothetical protein